MSDWSWLWSTSWRDRPRWLNRLTTVWVGVGAVGLIILNHTHRQRWWGWGYVVVFLAPMLAITVVDIVHHRRDRGSASRGLRDR
jgi:peptidoglycan/LPS O-acetylase OafA/YrhL